MCLFFPQLVPGAVESLLLGNKLLLDGHFLTWLLIGWQLCCQPIISHVRKLLLGYSNFTTNRVGKTSPVVFRYQENECEGSHKDMVSDLH